jgi:hypothetical protein
VKKTDKSVDQDARGGCPKEALSRIAVGADPCLLAELRTREANAVEAAYRRGDLFEKRRHLINDWAAFCERGARSM